MALRIDIASPCTQAWSAMRGDERTRFCAACQLNVYNVAELTEAQVLELVGKGGRVCGRLFRRRDGTVLLKDCPVGVSRARRALALAAVTVVALGLGLFAAPRDAGGPPVALRSGLEGVRQAVSTRVVEAREWLRGTVLFGPLIDRLYPPEVVGDIAMVVPAPSSTR